MVKGPRYVLEESDSNGAVLRRELFKTQKAVASAVSKDHNMTEFMVREFFRKNKRIKTGPDAKKDVYKKYSVHKYILKKQ
tara:strand:+ start:129 stop:368 length:240 start_codon:yes stop_codon:yes gene_type:complete